MSNHIELMIIGAPKSATSSLKDYLGSHPDVVAHAYREMNFFLNDDEYSKGFDVAKKRYFPTYSTEKKIVAKSVAVMYSEAALQRMYKHNPKMKLIAILRNPVDRAYSAYWFARRQGWENIDVFEEAITAPISRFGNSWIKISGCSYLEYGIYDKYLNRVIEIFGRDALSVYSLEELMGDFLAIGGNVLNLLNLKSMPINVPKKRSNQAAYARSNLVASVLTNQSRAKKIIAKFIPWTLKKYLKSNIQSINEVPFTPPPMNAETRKKLKEYYSLPNERLSNLFGKKFDW